MRRGEKNAYDGHSAEGIPAYPPRFAFSHVALSGKIKNELMLVLDLTAFAASGLRAGLKRPVHLRLIIYDHLSCSDEADYHGLRKK